MKYTPGPWTVETGFKGPIGGPQETPYITVLQSDDGTDGIVIADCPHYEGNNGHANARLIAACPDLLSACIDALREIDNGAGYRDRLATADKLRAAIALATSTD